ncbi:unnamed protein product [Rotaria sp. Silwood1]|nr:unnamed protein product [Rotaria sp. Silwood1]
MSASYALYMIITSSTIRSADRAATESFIDETAVLLPFVYETLNFYIYTLVSLTYRREFRMALERCVTSIQRRFSFAC